MVNANTVAARIFAVDLAACIRLSDARKADNAARRAACRNNAGLTACLLADAQRRGQASIDWAEYFRNAGI